jgi:hypothetical protein
VDRRVAESLQWLADAPERLEDFVAARKARQEGLDLRKKLHGERDWRVTDARLSLEDADRLARLDAAQRAELRRASELNLRVFRLWHGVIPALAIDPVTPSTLYAAQLPGSTRARTAVLPGLTAAVACPLVRPRLPWPSTRSCRPSFMRALAPTITGQGGTAASTRVSSAPASIGSPNDRAASRRLAAGEVRVLRGEPVVHVDSLSGRWSAHD